MRQKNYFNYLVLLLAPLFALVSCKEVIEPTPPSPIGSISPFTIQVVGNDAQSMTASINYDSNAEQYPYFVGVIEKSIYDKDYSANPEGLVQYAMGTPAKLSTMTVDNTYIFSGNATVNLSKTWALQRDMSYYVYVFSLEAGTNTLLTNIEIQGFTVTTNAATDGLAGISVTNIAMNDFLINVDAGNYEGTYTIYIMPKEVYEDAGGDDQALAAQLFATDLADYGPDIFSKVDNIFNFQGDTKLSATDRELPRQGTDYYVLAVGFKYTAPENEEDDGTVELTTSAIGTSVTTLALPEPEFTIAVDEVTPNAIDLSITANGFSGQYAVLLLESSLYKTAIDEQGFGGDAGYTAEQLAILFSRTGVPLELYSGDNSISLSEDWLQERLQQGVKYTAVAFGLDASKKASTRAAVQEITVESIALGAPFTSITISNVGYQSADAAIEVGDFMGNYHVVPIEKTQYDNDLTTLSIEEIFQNSLYKVIDAGYDFKAITDKTSNYIFTGSGTVPIDGIWQVKPETEYYLMAAGVNEFGQLLNRVAISEMFTTTVAPEYNVEFTVEDIKDNSARVAVVPNVNSTYYFTDLVKKSDFENLTVENVLTILDWQIANLVWQGRTEYDPNTMNLSPGTDYVVYAFSYDLTTEMASSEMFYKEFKTTGEQIVENPVPTSVTIPTDVPFGEISASNITANGATISVTPIDKEMYYMLFTTDIDTYNGLGTPEDIILSDYDFFKSVSGGDTSFWDVLALYAYAGDDSFPLVLTPDTEYVIYVYGLNMETGAIISNFEISKFRTLANSAAPMASAANGTIRTEKSTKDGVGNIEFRGVATPSKGKLRMVK